MNGGDLPADREEIRARLGELRARRTARQHGQDPGPWEERMATNAATRETIRDAEGITRSAAAYVPTHLHGTSVTCPCGSESGGITTVAFIDDYEPPSACPECGKPIDRWGDLKSAREVERHMPGCAAGPNPELCPFCDKPIAGGMWIPAGGGRVAHTGCPPWAPKWTLISDDDDWAPVTANISSGDTTAGSWTHLDPKDPTLSVFGLTEEHIAAVRRRKDVQGHGDHGPDIYAQGEPGALSLHCSCGARICGQEDLL